jgi:drug/metabolite transporter (DMT)-like permease
MTLWGIAWPVGRLLAMGLPPVSIAAIRYAIVVPVFLLILKLREHSVRISKSWVPTFVLLGILSTTLYQIFFIFGVKYAAASDDSLVIGVAPILVAVLASYIIKERLTRMKIAGLLMGLSGIVLIADLSPNVKVNNRILGVSLVFGGAVVYALYTVLLRRFLNSNSSIRTTEPRPSSLAMITWISLFGWLFLIPLSVLESPWSYAWDINSWLGILYLALLSTVVGYFFYVEGVSQIGASRTSIFGNLIPVFGVLSSFLLLGESISIWHVASFFLIFLGVLLVNRAPVSLATNAAATRLFKVKAIFTSKTERAAK